MTDAKFEFDMDHMARALKAFKETTDFLPSETLQKVDQTHTCHWPGCQKVVPLKMWGCRGHWFRLPVLIRARIWRTYRPGQRPSAEYIKAMKEAQEWIAMNCRP